MPGRWPGWVPKLSGRAWGANLAAEVERWMRRMSRGMSNLQRTPDTPTQIQAGVAANRGTGPAIALDDHVHNIKTGQPLGLANLNSEGSGTALLRADAGIKRDVRVKQGGVDVATRNALDLGFGLTATDDPGNDEVDIAVNADAIDSGWARHFMLGGSGE